MKALWEARHLPRDLAHRRAIQRETIGLNMIRLKTRNTYYRLFFKALLSYFQLIKTSQLSKYYLEVVTPSAVRVNTMCILSV